MTIWDELGAPFDDVRSYSVRGATLQYVNAAQVEARLDEVVGPDNWSAEYKVLSWTPLAVECRLTINEMTKSNVGEADEEDEAVKAAYSDAFKRAARAFGIARYLNLGGRPDRAPTRQPQRQEPRQKPQDSTPAKGGITTPQAFWAKARGEYNLTRERVLEILNVDHDAIANATPAELTDYASLLIAEAN